MKALIVDDEPYIQLIIKKILSRKGIDSIICNNGKETSEILKSSNKFEYIFLDISLPDINGLDLIESIKKFLPDSKIILMSGYHKENIENINNYSFDYFIFKPELTEVINSIIK
ncbi:MAG: response regulator [Spirochaetes bacterium]|nr:response regulator [Spirochaetota bacterium]